MTKPTFSNSNTAIDAWDILDPVDILPKLPESWAELLASKKWLERKEALDSLLQLLIENPRLSTNANYGDIVGKLGTILAKDANINVVCDAAKCIKGLASGLREKFAPFSAHLAVIVFDKFKEKKPILRDTLIECIDAIYSTTVSVYFTYK